jgi:hypothetical protein
VTARINLSIPDELKERMDKFPDINWSRAAQDSFETQINIHELKEKNMTTEAGLARLRASKKTNTEREEAEGIATGKAWAIDQADYDELRRVAALSESDTEENAISLATAIMGDEQSWRDAAECMESLFGAKEPSDDLIAGFIQGAAEVFDEV